MTLLSMQDSTSSTGSPLICEHCDSGDSAVSRCSDCSVFVCEFCVTAHKRINATKNHQILSLTEVKKLGSKALVKPSFCSKHKGETLKLFCSTCQKTICRDCTIVDHREHKYDFVTDVAEKEKEIIQGFLAKAKVKEHAVVDGIKAVQTMKNGVQKRVSEANKEVDAFYDEQVKALNYYRANIKHEVFTEGQIRVSKLENQADVLSSFLAKLRSGISFTDQALQDGDDVKLLAMKKQLVQQLDQLNSSKTSCKPCKDDYLELQVHQTIWDVGEIVSVCCVPFDPQKCTVSMVGGEEGVMYHTLAGQEVDLLVLVKDGKGQKKPKGGHQVEAMISFSAIEPDLTGENFLVPVRDNSDGSYSFLYHPVEEGQVTLSVKVQGQKVFGSPFKWNVTSKLLGELSLPQAPPQAKSAKRKKGKKGSLYYPVTKFSALKEGMHCWKLKLTCFSDERKYDLEIGITSYTLFLGEKQTKWAWQYSSGKQPKTSRSDGQIPSITSVEDNDVFIVFLNLESKKLTIYNVRSKQTEIFVGINKGGKLSPIIRCDMWQLRYGDKQYPRLALQ